MEEHLENWIKQAEASGIVDSEGSFSLDFQRAIERLKSFQLSHPVAWVFKFVQTANSLGVPLSVVQSKKETELVFEGFPGWPQSEVLHALSALMENKVRPLSHLSVGVRLLMNSNLAFQLTCSDGKMLVWNGTELEAVDDPRPTGFRIGIPHFEIGQRSWLFNLGSAAARKRQFQILQMFQKLCSFSSTEVTLDSLEVSGLFREPVFGVQESRRPLAVSFSEDHDALPRFKLRGGEIRGFSKIHQQLERDFEHYISSSHSTNLGLLTTVFFQNLGHRRKNAQLGYVSKKPGMTLHSQRSELVWVLDGVPVQREALSHGGAVAVLIVVSAEGLATDLTTLALRQTEALAQRRQEAMETTQKRFRTSESIRDLQQKIETIRALYGPTGPDSLDRETEALLREGVGELVSFDFVNSLTGG